MSDSGPRNRRPWSDIDEVELDQPDLITVIKIIWHTVRDALAHPFGRILFSAFLLLMIWGHHGYLDLLSEVWSAWRGPGVAPYEPEGYPRPVILPWVPWDLELVFALTGFVLLVVIPCLVIRLWLRLPLSEFGLALPPPERRNLAILSFVFLTAISLPAFYAGALHDEMQSIYPYYRPFTGCGAFAFYQLTVLFFYITIEFVFRGYLLFGVAHEEEKMRGGAPVFPHWALLIQMLSYTAWHLGKPLPEVWGTLAWGLAAGAVTLAIRSVWPVIMSHWVLNVFMDWLILKNLGIPPAG
jgi:hypothetical protein